MFNWTVSGGSIVSGNGSATITVTPNGDSNPVATTCIVKRSTGLSNYTRSSTKTIDKSARTASFYPVYGTTTAPLFDYMCKGGGTAMKIDAQCGLTSVNWIAPNCTINGQGTLTATIIPNSSQTNGSTIDVYAIAQYQGGCTATTAVKSFKIFEGTLPPQPSGYVKFIPINGDVCMNEGYEIEFIPNAPYLNGKISVTPAIIPPW